MSLSSRLKAQRKALGLSQKALARHCGVSQPTIANWENGGHVPRQSALASIAQYLNVDPVWLLSGEHTGGQSPARQHLACPIRQIAVYDWTPESPDSFTEIEKTKPIQYITLSLQTDAPLALCIKTPQLDSFPKGTILIFDRQDRRDDGIFLFEAENQLSLRIFTRKQNELKQNERGGEKKGRLIHSLHQH